MKSNLIAVPVAHSRTALSRQGNNHRVATYNMSTLMGMMWAVLQDASPSSLCDLSILSPQQMGNGEHSAFRCEWGTASSSSLGDIHTAAGCPTGQPSRATPCYAKLAGVPPIIYSCLQLLLKLGSYCQMLYGWCC